MGVVPWLSRALRTKAPANPGISRPTKNQQPWRSRRSSGTATTNLLSDACHPTLPFLAQGAGQAVKDAAALAHCLSAKSAHFRTALTRYETASAHRPGLTADQAYRTISYDRLPTLISIQLCGGAGGARARDLRITNRPIAANPPVACLALWRNRFGLGEATVRCLPGVWHRRHAPGGVQTGNQQAATGLNRHRNRVRRVILVGQQIHKLRPSVVRGSERLALVGSCRALKSRALAAADRPACQSLPIST